MDTKVIGRGVELMPGEAPEIKMIYVRNITHESDGNAVGMGLADIMHERLYRQVDFQKTYLNCSVALNPEPARMPLHVASDSAGLYLALGNLGWPEAGEQKVVWIRNTQCLNRLAVSEAPVNICKGLPGWRVTGEPAATPYDSDGNLPAYL